HFLSNNEKKNRPRGLRIGGMGPVRQSVKRLYSKLYGGRNSDSSHFRTVVIHPTDLAGCTRYSGSNSPATSPASMFKDHGVRLACVRVNGRRWVRGDRLPRSLGSTPPLVAHPLVVRGDCQIGLGVSPLGSVGLRGGGETCDLGAPVVYDRLA